ncbi:TPA: glycosyltransferase, partial [Pseudomonas aeruginosa]|nr:glycosyltransferase [Pseudomonas aeruginosa]
MKMSDLLIIIPAYNEEGSIENVVNNIIQNYPQYDYVIINDGSRDKTSQICHENHYNIVDLPVNLGLAGAFQTGLRYAYEHGYNKAVQFDA